MQIGLLATRSSPFWIAERPMEAWFDRLSNVAETVATMDERGCCGEGKERA